MHAEMENIPKTMHVWTIAARGPPSSVLKFAEDVRTPKITKDNEVIVKVAHASLHPGTSLLMHIIPRFFRSAPYIAETDFSGTIVAVGNGVPTVSPNEDDGAKDKRYFPIGAQVFGSIPVPAHLKGSGALAEYVTIETDFLAIQPASLSSSDASSLSVSAITALDVVALANPQPGQRILINAPTGGVGHFATQLIRHAIGPSGYLVGVCSQDSSTLAKGLGCDEVGDYGNYCDGTSVYHRLAALCRENGQFDAVVDCYGSQALWNASERLLKEGNGHVYATVGPRFTSMSLGAMVWFLGEMMSNMLKPALFGGVRRTYKQAASFINTEKLETIKRLVEEGVIKPKVVDIFNFADAQQAYEMVISGHAKGKVVIEVAASS